MSKGKFSVNWLSKLIDLLIVILGITIAFNLNTWKESRQNLSKQQEYLQSFLSESLDNQTSLKKSLDFCRRQESNIDTLLTVVNTSDSQAEEVKKYALRLLYLSGEQRYSATMENITSSGEFSLIRDRGLRKKIVQNYRFFEELDKLEELSHGFVRKYFGPILLENRKRSQLESQEFQSEIGYLAMVYRGSVAQQAEGYEFALDKVNALIEALEKQLN